VRYDQGSRNQAAYGSYRHRRRAWRYGQSLGRHGKIKLTKSDAKSGGKHHIIPPAWVERVDAHVHLDKPARDAMTQWQTAA
jgi:hypothetical protein